MQGDDIGLFQERREILHTLDAELLKLGIGDVGIVADHLHAPRPHEFGDTATDPAETDNAQRDAWIAVLFAMTNERSLEFHVSPAAGRFQITVALAGFL